MSTLKRYYSRMRPVMPGSYPREGVVRIRNFDWKTEVKEIGSEAWGYIEYDRELSEKELEEWELTPADEKLWFCVTVAIYEDGMKVSKITETKKAVVKPESTEETDRKKTLVKEWFDSREKAEHFVEEVNID